MEIWYLLLGLLVGGLAGWMMAYFKYKNSEFNEEIIRQKYVLKELYQNILKQSDQLKDDLADKEQAYLEASKALSAKEQVAWNLEEKLRQQNESVEGLQRIMKTEFENIAGKLLEEKSEKFVRTNHKELLTVLGPLQTKIREFEEGIEKKLWKQSEDHISLKKEIEHLRDLNMQLSTDANNLVSALKGDNKTQGDWGEFRLEMLLERAGLNKDIHFRTQASFKNIKGQIQRPDFIINLPEDKHLIIDSKVSLTAYEKYFNATEPDKKEKYLKRHLDSLKQHIKELSAKNYTQLYQVNTPDYLLMFVPVEPALYLALQKDPNLYLDALDKNIVLVTTSTLLATMRTVSFIWKQEKQKNNVLEIAKQSGLLYDKFVSFVEDLKDVGKRLDSAQSSYEGAMRKLTESKKKGDTLIGRAERIRELGAKSSRRLPKELLEKVD